MVTTGEIQSRRSAWTRRYAPSRQRKPGHPQRARDHGPSMSVEHAPPPPPAPPPHRPGEGGVRGTRVIHSQPPVGIRDLALCGEPLAVRPERLDVERLVDPRDGERGQAPHAPVAVALVESARP